MKTRIHWRHAVASIAYSLGQITLGLLLHPYQTMQTLVPDTVFVWMTALPTIALAMVTLAWRYLVVPFVQLVFSCQVSSFVGCEWVSFTSNWLTFFCIYWQILLLYLLLRFKWVWR